MSKSKISYFPTVSEQEIIASDLGMPIIIGVPVERLAAIVAQWYGVAPRYVTEQLGALIGEYSPVTEDDSELADHPEDLLLNR